VKHQVRRLEAGDEAALDRFLSQHPDSSMFVRSNLRRVGFVDRGEPYQGTYVAAFDGAAIVGVVAHFWNGMVVVQAPDSVEVLAPRTLAASGRNIVGLLGPGEQVARARHTLGLSEGEAMEDSTDDLLALDLSALSVPADLAAGRVIVRHPEMTELSLMADWSAAFHCEALGFAESAELRRDCIDCIGRLQNEKAQFVLEAAGAPVAYAAFNAVLPEMVQLGGVWTPPELRGKGYARNVVAGALLAARAADVKRAVLFTENDNQAAQSAYRSLGFVKIGAYGIVIFPESKRL